MNDTSERPAVEGLRPALAGSARLEAGPLDVADACRQYTEEGFDITPRLRVFLEAYGELTVTWTFKAGETDLSTSIERTLEAPHATPRTTRIFTQRIGRSVIPVGAASSCTEDCILLADNGDILLGGDAGIQRVANGFEDAVRALVAGDWDKTFF
ncbi:SUKH-3 domain-containing protein [Streptomyces sp. YGL11-2]|uniref:SUKH-3 domain-containing protein n=1 Tax=Streptomyces sp. YGL11-2 TaxID=3414028 RepID=UPI003CEA084D